MTHITIIAGSVKGYREGNKRSARFSGVSDVCYVPQRDIIYVSDSANHRIRKIDRYGTVTTFAGSGDSQVVFMRLKFPKGICYVPSRDCIYVCDAFNNRIRCIDAVGCVSTVAGGTEGWKDGKGEDAMFYYPSGICYCEVRDCLYVCDYFNYMIREIDNEFNVRTVAGSIRGYADGCGEQAMFQGPTGIIYVEEHDCFFICDTENHCIRKMDARFNVTNVAGSNRGWCDGQGKEAMFDCPDSICYVPVDDCLYVTDFKNGKLRKIDSDFNVITVNFTNVGRVSDMKGIYYDETRDNLIISGDDRVLKVHLIEPLNSNVIEKRSQLVVELFKDRQNSDLVLKSKNGEMDIHRFLLNCRLGIKFFNKIASSELTSKQLDILMKYCYQDVVEETNLDTLVEMDMVAKNLGIDYLSILIHSKISDLLSELQIDVEFNLFRPDAKGQSNYREDLLKIFSQRKYCDISIKVTDVYEETVEFHGHKAIILHQSDYFNAFFSFQKFNPSFTHTTNLSMNAFYILFNTWYLRYPDMKTISVEDLIYLIVWGPMYLSRNSDLFFEHCCRSFNRKIQLNGIEELTQTLSKFNMPMLKNLLQFDHLYFLHDQITSTINDKQ